VLADENARRIAAFLARTPDAQALDRVPAWFGVASGAGRQHFPGDQGLDGFYYAVLARR
jgi:16S rRNA (cytosine967-C5)-methyltransferase